MELDDFNKNQETDSLETIYPVRKDHKTNSSKALSPVHSANPIFIRSAPLCRYPPRFFSLMPQSISLLDVGKRLCFICRDALIIQRKAT